MSTEDFLKIKPFENFLLYSIFVTIHHAYGMQSYTLCIVMTVKERIQVLNHIAFLYICFVMFVQEKDLYLFVCLCTYA